MLKRYISKHRILFSCDHCGEDFTSYASNALNKRFCSVKCKSEATRINRICKHCKKEFSICASVLKTNASGNFCTRSCYNEYLKTLTGAKSKSFTRVEKLCNNCGKDILVRKSKETIYKTHFCSRKCKTSFWSGERMSKLQESRSPIVGRSTEFNRVKRRHFRNRNFCALCGTFKNIHIHHIIPFRVSKDDDVSNLIPLCSSHHRKVEAITQNVLSSHEFELAHFFLNSELRSRQIATFVMLRDLIRSR